ncbi:phage portal protein [Tardiphaga sp. 862_B3_N1_1]|uniref:phage portal protein n=1 Tax=Tardiphaga sp. 862_B3_N1_1 TaxID=3240763 RepID=UPI003F8A286D
MTVYNSPLLAPIRWMFGWPHVGGKLTTTGHRREDQNKDCGPDAALQIATVWACIRLLAETISTLPMLVYRQAPNGGRSVDKTHPLYELLHDSPHYDYTAVEFWEGIAASLCIAGNAYAEKLYISPRSATNPYPRIIALQPLQADCVEVFRTASGARRYRLYGKRNREIAEEDMFHVRGFGNGGDEGLSPVSYARHTLNATRAVSNAGVKLYTNGMRNQGVLKMKGGLTPEQRVQAKENILNPIVEGGSGILEHEMEFQSLSMSARDAQMLETMSFQIEEICRWFRVPPFMIGHTQKSTSWGTGLEQQNIGFLIYSLRPYLSRIEQSIRRSLMSPIDRKTMTAEFKVEGLLRGDSAARMTTYATGVQNGIYTRNEVRSWENLPPDPEGNTLTVQSQNVPLGQQPTVATPALPPPEDDDEEAA